MDSFITWKMESQDLRVEIKSTNRILQGIKENKTTAYFLIFMIIRLAYSYLSPSHSTLNLQDATSLPLVNPPIPPLVNYPSAVHFEFLQMQALHNGDIKILMASHVSKMKPKILNEVLRLYTPRMFCREENIYSPKCLF